MNGFMRFMMGRYGPDQLTLALLILYLLIELVAQAARLPLLALVSLLLLVLAVFRMLSRDTNKRYRENVKFLKFWNPVKTKFQELMNRMKSSKTHRYFKCPGCGNTLRVPRGKGKIEITCPVCRHSFIKKT